MKTKLLKFLSAVMIAVMLVCYSPAGTAEYSSAVISSLAASSKKAKTKIQKTAVILVTGDSYTQKLLNEKGKAVTKNVKWSSANKKIATISSKGKITAKKAGKAKMTATYKKKKYTFTVTVKNAVLSSKKKTLYTGKSFTLSLKGNGKKISYKNIKFKSSNKKVATVSSKGVVKGVAPGKATISATYKGKAYKCTVSVKSEYTLSYSSKALSVGTVFTQSLKNSKGKAIDNKDIIWASSNTEVATVSSKGVVSGIKPGKATISAFYKSVTYKSVITVTASPALIYSERTITVGESFEQKLKNTNGKFVDNADIIWSSSNTDIATISSGGTVKGMSEGTATISAFYNNKIYKAVVTVKKAADVPPVTQAPSTTTPSTTTPSTTTPSTSVTAAPTTQPPTTAAPTTAAPTTAAPTTTVPTTAVPTTAVPATTAPVTESAEPLSVELDTVGSGYLFNYETVDLKWTIKPNDKDVKIKFYSDDPKVATVDEKGRVTGLIAGVCEIYIEVTRGNETATDSVSILVEYYDPFATEPTNHTIDITDNGIHLTEGLTYVLDYNITPFGSGYLASWHSSNTDVATVDSNGTITAKGEGIAIISAETNRGKSDTCMVIVGPKVLALAPTIDKFYEGGPNSRYIQSFYEYCNELVEMNTISPNAESFEYTDIHYPIVMNYLSEITGEGTNLTIANSYYLNECFHSYGLYYTGEDEIIPQHTQQYTDDTVTRYSVTLYCAYDGQIGHKVMYLYCSDGLEFRDLGLRYQKDKADNNPKGPSMGAGVSRVNSSYKTTDNRFSAKFGEAVVLRNGQPADFELKTTMHGSGSSAYCDYYFKCNEKEYKFAVPLDGDKRYIQTYRDLGIGGDMLNPFKSEPFGESFVHTDFDNRNNKIWVRPNYNGEDIEDINMRVFYKDEAMLIMYLYIDTKAYDDDSIIEIFTVTDLISLE